MTRPTDIDADTRIRFAVPEVTEADIEAVTHVLRRGWITTGEQCRQLEEELAAYLGVAHVVAVASCTHALEISIASLNLPPHTRVAVPTWTFAASALAATRVGAIPVLIDVDPQTLNIATESLVAAIAEGIDAVVVVHFGGVPVDEGIYQICAAAGIPVIEDAAHALGASDQRGMVGQSEGSLATCFSFYATKNLTSGEGGAIATSSSELDGFARRFRLHGLTRDGFERQHSSALYDVDVPGIKANMPDILAAMARSQLARFSDTQEHRRMLVEHYRKVLGDIEGLTLIPTGMRQGGADHLLVTVLPRGSQRDRVMSAMTENGIETSVHFRPLHHLSWFRDNATIGPTGTRVADEMAPRVLSLPLHTGLGLADVERVAEALAEALASASV